MCCSFTQESDITAESREKWMSRDERYNVSSESKKKQREYIKEPEIHPGKLIEKALTMFAGADIWKDADQKEEK